MFQPMFLFSLRHRTHKRTVCLGRAIAYAMEDRVAQQLYYFVLSSVLLLRKSGLQPIGGCSLNTIEKGTYAGQKQLSGRR